MKTRFFQSPLVPNSFSLLLLPPLSQRLNGKAQMPVYLWEKRRRREGGRDCRAVAAGRSKEEEVISSSSFVSCGTTVPSNDSICSFLLSYGGGGRRRRRNALNFIFLPLFYVFFGGGERKGRSFVGWLLSEAKVTDIPFEEKGGKGVRRQQQLFLPLPPPHTKR